MNVANDCVAVCVRKRLWVRVRGRLCLCLHVFYVCVCICVCMCLDVVEKLRQTTSLDEYAILESIKELKKISMTYFDGK